MEVPPIDPSHWYTQLREKKSEIYRDIPIERVCKDCQYKYNMDEWTKCTHQPIRMGTNKDVGEVPPIPISPDPISSFFSIHTIDGYLIRFTMDLSPHVNVKLIHTELKRLGVFFPTDDSPITDFTLGKLDGALNVIAQLSMHHPDYDIVAARFASAILEFQLIEKHRREKKMDDNLVPMEMIFRGLTQVFDPSSQSKIKQKYNTFTKGNNGLRSLLRKDLTEMFVDKFRLEWLVEEIDKLSKLYDEKTKHNIEYGRLTYAGFKTIYNCLLKDPITREPLESIQSLFMRVALGRHVGNIERVEALFRMLTERRIMMASPFLFSCGTMNERLSSCFLLKMQEDSMDGIYNTLKESAMISKGAGGVSIDIHPIRAAKTHIFSTNGESQGILPMLKVFEETSRYVDQGGGKRKGAFAIWMEPFHSEITKFVDLRLPTGGTPLERTHSLYTGLWIPDLFMKRVRANAKWTLFSPNVVPDLHEVWGEEFEKLYEEYEKDDTIPYKKVVNAREIWDAILHSQIESSFPYMCYKDQANRCSNQQQSGTIHHSNLCTEIMEISSEEETAVCNLCSISLPDHLDVEKKQFDWKKFKETVHMAVLTLNTAIDDTVYPGPRTKNSNLRHRPIGIGIQGLANLFFKLSLPFESNEALELNRQILERLYYYALKYSNRLAREQCAYDSFDGSPLSKGILHFEYFEHHKNYENLSIPIEKWAKLRGLVQRYGTRNSLLVALMPTATTSFILGNVECFEPQTNNVVLRKALTGEFAIVNADLVAALEGLGLWDFDESKNGVPMMQKIIASRGSIQKLEEIPKEIREIYKTAWEMKGSRLLDLAVARAPFVDQSQSLNVFMAQPTVKKLEEWHFAAWMKGLKTGSYYIRSQPVTNAQQFTVTKETMTTLTSPDVKQQQQQQQQHSYGGDVKITSSTIIDSSIMDTITSKEEEREKEKEDQFVCLRRGDAGCEGCNA